MAALWCTSSSSYLVNGEPRKRVLHCKGVRQGDPLSPMIFLLAMEPLHRLFQKAQDEGLLSVIKPECAEFRVSLYADDAVVFIKPEENEWRVANCILDILQELVGS